MSQTVVPALQVLPSLARLGPLERVGRRLTLAALDRLREGRVEVIEEASSRVGGSGQGPAVRVRVRDPRFYAALAFRGSVGVGQAYMDGLWDCDDLPGLIELLVLNDDAREGIESPLAALRAPLLRAAAMLSRSGREASRRHIRAHYDLGDEFFALFLDPSMTYSCAIFENERTTLAEAQREKIDRACRKLDLSSRDHLLEIGTGWGAAALHAAREYGCTVTTTTISDRQHAWATRAVEEAGLAGKVRVIRSDFRDLQGRYDKLLSIEMIEAVGAANLDAYFRACCRLLKPEGMMLLQAITIRDQRFEAASHRVDFLKRHIFPGSCLPSVARMMDSVRRVTDFGLFHSEEIGPHYVTTLRRWREAYLARLDQVRAMGYPESFVRMWDFYLAYCEGVFASRRTGDVQMLLMRPRCRREPYVERGPRPRGVQA